MPGARVGTNSSTQVLWGQTCKDDMTARPVTDQVVLPPRHLSGNERNEKDANQRHRNRTIQSHGKCLVSNGWLTCWRRGWSVAPRFRTKCNSGRARRVNVRHTRLRQRLRPLCPVSSATRMILTYHLNKDRIRPDRHRPEEFEQQLRSRRMPNVVAFPGLPNPAISDIEATRRAICPSASRRGALVPISLS